MLTKMKLVSDLLIFTLPNPRWAWKAWLKTVTIVSARLGFCLYSGPALMFNLGKESFSTGSRCLCPYARAVASERFATLTVVALG
jgi:hypothetical protein